MIISFVFKLNYYVVYYITLVSHEDWNLIKPHIVLDKYTADKNLTKLNLSKLVFKSKRIKSEIDLAKPNFQSNPLTEKVRNYVGADTPTSISATH